MTQRFATVQEFWQAVQGESGPQPTISEALNSLGVSSSAAKAGKMGAPTEKVLQGKPEKHSHRGVFISVVLALLLILGIGAGIWSYAGIRWNGLIPVGVGSGSVVQPPTLSPVSHPPTVLPPRPGTYPRLATSYNGIIADTLANVRSPMTLTQMRQNGSRVSGLFNGLQISAPYTGIFDTSNTLNFTVAGKGGNAPLYFNGKVQKDGTLSGGFYAIDQNGYYVGGTNGWWNVAPTAPIK